jgi:2-dehydropantoate 2-reductase
MKVVVVGAGGTGGLYGGLLARAAHEVGFLARGAHLEAIRAHGLRIESAQLGAFTVEAPASANPSDLGQADADLVLFAVKTYDLQSAAEAANQVLAPSGVLLTLQNGVEAPDQVAAIVGRERVLIGTTSLETTISAPGVISHLSSFHRVTVSEMDGPSTQRVTDLVAALQAASIQATAVESGRQALWEKAAFLIPMAGLTAVTGEGIGLIRSQPETRTLLMDVLNEVVAVAHAYGVDLSRTADAVRGNLDKMAPTMKASMARDFERGRPTELDALTGSIVRLGAARGVPTPSNRALYAVLKLRETAGQPAPVTAA